MSEKPKLNLLIQNQYFLNIIIGWGKKHIPEVLFQEMSVFYICTHVRMCVLSQCNISLIMKVLEILLYSDLSWE